MFFLMKDSSEFFARQHVQNEMIRVLIKSPKSRTEVRASLVSLMPVRVRLLTSAPPPPSTIEATQRGQSLDYQIKIRV